MRGAWSASEAGGIIRGPAPRMSSLAGIHDCLNTVTASDRYRNASRTNIEESRGRHKKTGASCAAPVPILANRSSQKANFKPNWTRRGLLIVFVTTPKLPLLLKDPTLQQVPFGGPN